MTGIGFTRDADRLLGTLPADDRARIGNWALQIALGRGDTKAGVKDIRIAQRVAGPEFLPVPGEFAPEEEEDRAKDEGE